jgi:sigma-B regulation protein RsbU (phosphoserine phosphatase)
LGSQLNAIIFRDGIDNRFVTLFYFEIDPASGRMRYLNAGHNPPFVLRASGIEALPASAIPLGMMEGTTYTESELTLRDGDTLVIYSDGLTEARNVGDEEFGADRLRALMPRLRGHSAERGVRVIIDEVNSFLAGERPHDDMSLVVLSRPGEVVAADPPVENVGPVPPPRIVPPPPPG